MPKSNKISYDPFNMKVEDVSQKEEPKEFTRHTFVIRSKHLDNIKTAAYWQRLSQKAVLDRILEEYFKKNDPKAGH